MSDAWRSALLAAPSSTGIVEHGAANLRSIAFRKHAVPNHWAPTLGSKLGQEDAVLYVTSRRPTLEEIYIFPNFQSVDSRFSVLYF